MRMLDQIKKQVLTKEFFSKNGLDRSPGNSKTRFFCFIRVEEAANISKICYMF